MRHVAAGIGPLCADYIETTVAAAAWLFGGLFTLLLFAVFSSGADSPRKGIVRLTLSCWFIGVPVVWWLFFR